MVNPHKITEFVIPSPVKQNQVAPGSRITLQMVLRYGSAMVMATLPRGKHAGKNRPY